MQIPITEQWLKTANAIQAYIELTEHPDCSYRHKPDYSYLLYCLFNEEPDNIVQYSDQAGEALQAIANPRINAAITAAMGEAVVNNIVRMLTRLMHFCNDVRSSPAIRATLDLEVCNDRYMTEDNRADLQELQQHYSAQLTALQQYITDRKTLTQTNRL